jgi:hypothetical protein
LSRMNRIRIVYYIGSGPATTGWISGRVVTDIIDLPDTYTYDDLHRDKASLMNEVASRVRNFKAQQAVLETVVTVDLGDDRFSFSSLCLTDKFR